MKISLSSNVIQRRASAFVDWTIQVTGQESGTPESGFMYFSATEDLDVTATGDVVIEAVTIYDDGTLDGNTVRAHEVEFSCPNEGSGAIVVKGGQATVVSVGEFAGIDIDNDFINFDFYEGNDDASPIVHLDYNRLPRGIRRITTWWAWSNILIHTGSRQLPPQLVIFNIAEIANTNLKLGRLPKPLLEFYISNYDWRVGVGSNSVVLDTINVSIEGELPPDIIRFAYVGLNLTWDNPVGVMPDTLTQLEIHSNNVVIDIQNIPEGLSGLFGYIGLEGDGIHLNHTGLIRGLEVGGTVLRGENINWSYDGDIGNQIFLLLDGPGINWTGTTLGASPPFLNPQLFELKKFRATPNSVTPAELIALLTSFRQRFNNTGTGTPARTSITFGEYDESVSIADIQAATANISGTDAEKIKYWINQILPRTGTLYINDTPFT